MSLVDPNGLDWGVANWTDPDGTRCTRYRWFDGPIGHSDVDGQDYKPVDFGEDSSRVIDLSDGRTLSISNDSRQPKDITVHPQAEQEPVLPPSLLDRFPVTNSTRQFLFHYTTHHFERATVDFGNLAGELAMFAAPIAAPAEAAAAAAEKTGAETLFYYTDEATAQLINESGQIGVPNATTGITRVCLTNN
jgi:hypothetical protein